jgi:hypothetical protein
MLPPWRQALNRTAYELVHPKIVRVAARCRTIEIQAETHTIIAAASSPRIGAKPSAQFLIPESRCSATCRYPKVIQMDRRGHAVQGMDSVYVHVTDDMRRQLCDYLEGLWQQGIMERHKLAPRSAVPLLDQVLIAHSEEVRSDASPRSAEMSAQQRLRATRAQASAVSRGAR